MAKQSLADLNEYLFAQLDALSNDDLTGEELDKEIERSKAMQGIAKTIIDGAIPVNSAEATIIIRKLFDEAISIFEKHKINVNWNGGKE